MTITTKTFGYICVSTADQNIARQESKMKALGIDERDIYIDHASGKDFNRPHRLSSEDLVYVDAFDRLGRNYEANISE